MSKDTIYRQAAIDEIMGQPPEAHYPSWYAEQIKGLPSAEPEYKELQNWKTDFKGFIDDLLYIPRDDYRGIMEYIDEVPSTEPERKKGHWIYYDEYAEAVTHKCSECGKRMTTAIGVKASFCWNCGADMRERRVVNDR